MLCSQPLHQVLMQHLEQIDTGAVIVGLRLGFTVTEVDAVPVQFDELETVTVYRYEVVG